MCMSPQLVLEGGARPVALAVWGGRVLYAGAEGQVRACAQRQCANNTLLRPPAAAAAAAALQALAVYAK